MLGQILTKKQMYSLCLIVFALLLLTSCKGATDCSKRMTVEGVVADSSTSQPLSGVNIFSQDVDVRDITGEDGTYSFTDWTLGGFVGDVVRYEKTGYQTAYSEPVTQEETGFDSCGDFSITRNVAMIPQ